MQPIEFDSIAFGNPTARDHVMMLKENYLDKLLPAMKRFTPPHNSSSVTQNELRKLVEYVNAKRTVKDNMYDEGLLKMIKNHFIEAGANEEFVTRVTGSIAEDVIPLVTKLKYWFNRPRPLQLSWYYNMNFFPDFSYFVNNPSYPSGHSTLTAVTCHVLGNLYPEGYNTIKKIIAEARESRLYLGVHYPSDNDMAMVVAKAITENPEFKANYRL